ncbi:hypothetical protein ACIO6U_03820 [Streptomyces sp. NPDC087422]|uniref:hypothetical protein n=1 Tax=Streptomyces sp. NPDC087422 TaxID=3365786 RepID=UPI0037FD4EA6
MNATNPLGAWLTRLSLLAGVAFTATAEYRLARALGATEAIAGMLPVAVDAYVVAALQYFKRADIALSLLLMSAAQVAAHLLDAGVMAVNVPMVVIVSLLVPVAIWRTHALARRAPVAQPAAVEPEPRPVLTGRITALHVLPVPRPVPHDAIDKAWKPRALPPSEPPPAPAPELTAAEWIAARHKVRPGQLRTIADALILAPDLSGKAVGDRLGTSDRYGRRVLAAAKELTGAKA